MGQTDATTVAWTSPRSVDRSRRTARASRRTVLVALLANVAVTVAKLVGGLLSGSAAMFAEAAHSLADTVNQGFLFVSIALAVRDPTPEQPFGYGRLRFLWTFMAAVGMFLAGATFAVGYGVYQLTTGPHTAGYVAAYVTLAFSAVAEGSSWVRAIRHTRSDARDLGLPLLRFVRESRDPNVKMVLFEDTAAIIGIVIALAGILIDQLTGSSVFDPAASIAIGLLLITVAIWMARDTSELLVGASARPDERAALERALGEFEEIGEVFEVLTMVLGPNSLLVAARVDFAGGLAEDDVENVSEQIERRLRETVPDVTEVFLDATKSHARDRPRPVSRANRSG
jgi:cation diffusion facilitator family transporter